MEYEIQITFRMETSGAIESCHIDAESMEDTEAFGYAEADETGGVG
jgi:hypothetical protein